MEQTKLIKRRARLPSVFCAFTWVRRGSVCFVPNDPRDQSIVALFQDIVTQRKDVSELDDECSLVLAIAPECIQGSGAKYYWKLYDVDYMLRGASPPPNAVPIGEAGFSENDLLALATPDRYLSYIRNMETYLDIPEGHYFPKELEKQVLDFERQFNAKAKLWQKLLQLRVPRDAFPVETACETVSPKMKNAVLQFHAYSCFFDGKTRPEVPIHVHHVLPRRLIQRLSLPERLYTARENLVACCGGCNIVKSDELSKPDIQFYLKQFADPTHPNNRLIPFLENIRNLQEGLSPGQ